MSAIIHSVLAAILFFVIGSPALYNLVQAALGRFVTIAVRGAPTLTGLAVHSVVFGLVTLVLMKLSAKHKKRA